MEPTFREGERVFASALLYKLKKPQQGDVVILSHPFRSILIIKRIKKILENNKYIVTSDNPLESEDSASFGPVQKEKILGKVLFKY